MGCEYYSQCFFNESKPDFKPSDNAILMEVVKRNANLILPTTKEEERVLEDFKKKEI